jgi:hypothetical protein
MSAWTDGRSPYRSKRAAPKNIRFGYAINRRDRRNHSPGSLFGNSRKVDYRTFLKSQVSEFGVSSGFDWHPADRGNFDVDSILPHSRTGLARSIPCLSFVETSVAFWGQRGRENYIVPLPGFSRSRLSGDEGGAVSTSTNELLPLRSLTSIRSGPRARGAGIVEETLG